MPLAPNRESVDRFAHRTAEGDSFFELERYRLRYELRIELGFRAPRYIDVDLALGLGLDLLLELVDLGTLAADDDRRRDVWMLIFSLFAARSISTRETPAWENRRLSCTFSLKSSCSSFA
jgi:hypothetical protein